MNETQLFKQTKKLSVSWRRRCEEEEKGKIKRMGAYGRAKHRRVVRAAAYFLFFPHLLVKSAVLVGVSRQAPLVEVMIVKNSRKEGNNNEQLKRAKVKGAALHGTSFFLHIFFFFLRYSCSPPFSFPPFLFI